MLTLHRLSVTFLLIFGLFTAFNRLTVNRYTYDTSSQVQLEVITHSPSPLSSYQNDVTAIHPVDFLRDKSVQPEKPLVESKKSAEPMYGMSTGFALTGLRSDAIHSSLRSLQTARLLRDEYATGRSHFSPCSSSCISTLQMARSRCQGNVKYCDRCYTRSLWPAPIQNNPFSYYSEQTMRSHREFGYRCYQDFRPFPNTWPFPTPQPSPSQPLQPQSPQSQPQSNCKLLIEDAPFVTQTMVLTQCACDVETPSFIITPKSGVHACLKGALEGDVNLERACKNGIVQSSDALKNAVLRSCTSCGGAPESNIYGLMDCLAPTPSPSPSSQPPCAFTATEESFIDQHVVFAKCQCPSGPSHMYPIFPGNTDVAACITYTLAESSVAKACRDGDVSSSGDLKQSVEKACTACRGTVGQNGFNLAECEPSPSPSPSPMRPCSFTTRVGNSMNRAIVFVACECNDGISVSYPILPVDSLQDCIVDAFGHESKLASKCRQGDFKTSNDFKRSVAVVCGSCGGDVSLDVLGVTHCSDTTNPKAAPAWTCKYSAEKTLSEKHTSVITKCECPGEKPRSYSILPENHLLGCVDGHLGHDSKVALSCHIGNVASSDDFRRGVSEACTACGGNVSISVTGLSQCV